MPDPTENNSVNIVDHSGLPDNAVMPVDATSTAPEVPASPPVVSITDISASYDKNIDQAAPLNRDGSPKRKPGRPRKMASADQQALPGIDLGDGPSPAAAAPTPAKSPAAKRAARVSSDELARAVLHLSVGGMSALVGPEWDFQSPEEALGLKSAVSAYIEAKGDGQLTPENMLLLVVASYALPRFKEPNTREKIGGFFKGALNALRALFKR